MVVADHALADDAVAAALTVTFDPVWTISPDHSWPGVIG